MFKKTEGDIYEVEVSEYKGANYDSFIQVKDNDGSVKEFWVSRFELVEEEKKMYKEDDIYAGMKLECVSNGGFTHWTEGKVYVVNDNLQIYSDMDSSREVPTILQYLNDVNQFNVKFKVVEKEEITLTITGSNYQELLDQACELKRLLTVHVVNSELADSALVTIKEAFGGTK